MTGAHLSSPNFHEFALHGGGNGLHVGRRGLQGDGNVFGIGIDQTELAIQKGLSVLGGLFDKVSRANVDQGGLWILEFAWYVDGFRQGDEDLFTVRCHVHFLYSPTRGNNSCSCRPQLGVAVGEALASTVFLLAQLLQLIQTHVVETNAR